MTLKTLLRQTSHALLLSGLCCAPAIANTFVYVSNAEDGTVSRYRLNPQNGTLLFLGNTMAGDKVMPMSASPDGRHLYAALRSSPWSVLTYRIDAQNGDLTLLARNPLSASMPWITTDRSGRYLLSASYDSDVVTSNAIDQQGIATGNVTGKVSTGPHAHSVITDNSNRFAYAGNLGADRLLQYRLSDKGNLTPIGNGYVQAAEKSGPRHSAISPDNRFLYSVAEMAGTITRYALNAHSGALTAEKSWPSPVANKYHLQHGVERPADYNDPTPRIWAADIKMTPDGHYLYTSERTSSTVSGYRVNPQNGALTLLKSWPVEQQPRGMAIDASGRWLIVAGEKSAVIGSYAIDQKQGNLQRVSQAPAGKDANWVTIVNTP